jgi:predicted nuclease of restriction endonuclease-like (RecB) superfamily
MDTQKRILNMNSSEYLEVVEDVKARISIAQLRVLSDANTQMICLYWQIGSILNEHKAWGNKFIQNLAKDIRIEFPQATGYSFRNLRYMGQFAQTYSKGNLATAVAKLPWGHIIALMTKISDSEERDWYAQQAIENGWSRAILNIQIETNLYQRQVTATKTTNFERTLPAPQSDLANQMMKDSYVFDFIDGGCGPLKERKVERDMVSNICRLLLELGSGFAFVGEQYHLEVDGQDFYIDLLFYNLQLRSYVVVELKVTDFKPDYAGQISFYVTAVDKMLRANLDNPTIGILLCKGKTGLVADYALTGIQKPIGVAKYELVRDLPPELAGVLPSPKDIMSRMNKN